MVTRRPAVARVCRFPRRAGRAPGSITQQRDDLAGVRTIYGAAAPGMGTIAGWVLDHEGDGVFGVHVVATDANGITQVGALTTREGRFTLPSLPPGDYQLYVEPLNGAFTPKNLSDDYFHTTTTRW